MADETEDQPKREDSCPACGSVRMIWIRTEHGIDGQCERCGYRWHQPEPDDEAR